MEHMHFEEQDRGKVEAALDEALRDTFPCSDPIAVGCLVERERKYPVRQPTSATPDRVKPSAGTAAATDPDT